MNNNYFDYFNEILNGIGYNNENCSSCTNGEGINIDYSAGADNNNCKYFNSDINWGFQDINPMAALVLCDILSNFLSIDMPANVAGSFGNWLQLIAQTITTYNAQQVYLQAGPGRIYNYKFRNVTNPFCADTNNDGEVRPKKKNKKNDKEIKMLRKEIEDLKNQIQLLKNEINSLK